jgi:hypothetical protein
VFQFDNSYPTLREQNKIGAWSMQIYDKGIELLLVVESQPQFLYNLNQRLGFVLVIRRPRTPL